MELIKKEKIENLRVGVESYLYIPIRVEVINRGNATSIVIRIIHVFDVMTALGRVTRHHRLGPSVDHVRPHFPIIKHLPAIIKKPPVPTKSLHYSLAE